VRLVIGHFLVPLVAKVLELVPMFGEVVIVQLKVFPSGSWMVMLRVVSVMGIVVDPLVGVGLRRMGGVLGGAVVVVKW